VLARWAILPVSRALPPAKPGGAGALLRVTTPQALIGTAIAAAIAVPLIGASSAAAPVAAAAAALLLRRTLGGVTGDGYGATAKLTEVAVAVTLAASWG
jgi:adenosylcobinamide-GDP ribazoletransferase